MPLAYANMWTYFSSVLGFYRLFICLQCPLSPLMCPLHKWIYHVVFYVLLLISYWHYIQRMQILLGQEFKALQLKVFQMCVCMKNIVAYIDMWLRCVITHIYCFEYSMNAIFAYERIGHIDFPFQIKNRNSIDKCEMEHYIICVVMCRIVCALGIKPWLCVFLYECWWEMTACRWQQGYWVFKYGRLAIGFVASGAFVHFLSE